MENEQERELSEKENEQQPKKADAQTENEVTNYEQLYGNVEKEGDGAGDFGSATRPPGPESNEDEVDPSVAMPISEQNNELPIAESDSAEDESSDGSIAEESNGKDIDK